VLDPKEFPVSQFQHPRLSVPPPLMMRTEGSFAHLTLTQRLPTIVRRVIEENDYPSAINENLNALIQEIPEEQVRSLTDDAPDVADWETYLAPYKGKRWLDIPWFFAEAYFYRRILEATHYFQPGTWQGIDPFEPQKRRSLEKVMASVQAMSEEINTHAREGQWNRAQFIALCYFALWGNRIDLSLKPEEAGESDRSRIEAYREQANLIIDDTASLSDRIAKFRGAHLDIIADNAGFELFCDLCLADFLLCSGVAKRIDLHLKAQPMFVSDAMIKDVDYTLTVLREYPDEEVRRLGERLQEHIQEGRLQCCDRPFWTTPLVFWQMPDVLREELRQADLLFFKGDANYRRLLGDCQWSFTTPLEDIVCYFPATFATLRTLKSEVAAGLTAEQVEELNQKDSQWLVDGEWGMIQFVIGH
jgi:uncharacterized protein with ATP-grasp and redox domains